ncbi:DinB family protein [Arthrobacter flavus]|uniref:DinB family protein n=1 Tax=Arthrobacter flavus TaxID=95172 RepID=A0ABW4QAC8_9MICC
MAPKYSLIRSVAVLNSPYSDGMDLIKELTDQLRWHWDHQARPRLASLTDAEYFWEPVGGCWSVRPRGTGAADLQVGSGALTIDFTYPEPVPAPVTTIAWRMGHLMVGVLGARVGSHFGGEPIDYETFDYPGTAAEALKRLDGLYEQWSAGVAGLDPAALDRAVGPAEHDFAAAPMGALILHVNREMIHHLAEIALLRDLYVWRTKPGSAS